MSQQMLATQNQHRPNDGKRNSMLILEVLLRDDEAMAFAEFLKRVGYSNYRSLAASMQEAYEMQAAGEKLREALAQQGIAPR